MAKKQIESQTKAKEESEVQSEKRITLSVKDRLLLPDFFPERSNLVNQMIAQDIIQRIKIDQKERERIGLKSVPPSGLTWDDAKAKDADFTLTGVEIQFLKSQVQRLDGENALTMDMAKLAQKIKEI